MPAPIVPETASDSDRSPGAPITVVGWLVAAWCLAFAVVNVVYEVGGHFQEGPYAEYAAGISVMSWIVLVLKLLGAAIALLSISRSPRLISPRSLAVLVWGAAALLGLYSLGNVVQTVGMMAGLHGSPDQISPLGIGYVAFFLLGAFGYGVLATSFSRRKGIGRGAAFVGALGAPLVLGLILLALPLLLAQLGLLPS